MAVVGACGVEPLISNVPSSGPTLTVTGVVVAVDGPDLSQVERFTLRREDGTVYEFTVGRLELTDGGGPAPHLREHLVSGDPITVHYYESVGSGFVAVRYTDAHSQ